jgi:HJR/Mrr/RecB family endonuclease
MEKFFSQRARCSHGVRGGKLLLRCSMCANERLLAQQEQQKAAEREQIRTALNARSDVVEQQERERLHLSVLPSLAELRELSPQRFEDEIARMFERLGYTVEQTPYSNDHGRDAIMHRAGDKFLLECKKYAEQSVSGREDLQKFHSAVVTDGAKLGYFVTTGAISQGAKTFAASAAVPLEIIGSDELLRLMFKSKANPSADDTYDTACRTCGKIVRHSLRAPTPLQCSMGHIVQPTIYIDQLLGKSSDRPPACAKCGVPMRLVKGKTGEFWGCSRYPTCRSSRPVQSARRLPKRRRSRY